MVGDRTAFYVRGYSLSSSSLLPHHLDNPWILRDIENERKVEAECMWDVEEEEERGRAGRSGCISEAAIEGKPNIRSKQAGGGTREAGEEGRSPRRQRQDDG